MRKSSLLRNAATLGSILALTACSPKSRTSLKHAEIVTESPLDYLEQFDYSDQEIPSDLHSSLQRIDTLRGSAYTVMMSDSPATEFPEWEIQGIDTNGDLKFDEVYTEGNVPAHLQFLNTTEDFTDMVNHTFSEYITK